MAEYRYDHVLARFCEKFIPAALAKGWQSAEVTRRGGPGRHIFTFHCMTWHPSGERRRSSCFTWDVGQDEVWKALVRAEPKGAFEGVIEQGQILALFPEGVIERKAADAILEWVLNALPAHSYSYDSTRPEIIPDGGPRP